MEKSVESVKTKKWPQFLVLILCKLQLTDSIQNSTIIIIINRLLRCYLFPNFTI